MMSRTAARRSPRWMRSMSGCPYRAPTSANPPIWYAGNPAASIMRAVSASWAAGNTSGRLFCRSRFQDSGPATFCMPVKWRHGAPRAIDLFRLARERTGRPGSPAGRARRRDRTRVRARSVAPRRARSLPSAAAWRRPGGSWREANTARWWTVSDRSAPSRRTRVPGARRGRRAPARATDGGPRVPTRAIAHTPSRSRSRRSRRGARRDATPSPLTSSPAPQAHRARAARAGAARRRSTRRVPPAVPDRDRRSPLWLRADRRAGEAGAVPACRGSRPRRARPVPRAGNSRRRRRPPSGSSPVPLSGSCSGRTRALRRPPATGRASPDGARDAAGARGRPRRNSRRDRSCGSPSPATAPCRGWRSADRGSRPDQTFQAQRRAFQLVETAGIRLSIRTPADEARRMPEPAAVHLIVPDLADPHGLHGKPVLLHLVRIPAPSRSLQAPERTTAEIEAPFPGMSGEPHRQHAEFGEQFPPLRRRKTGAHSDVDEVGSGVEPEEERGDEGDSVALAHPDPCHHAVRRALVLDLDPAAAPRLVRERLLLGDDPVDASALEAPYPLAGDGGIGRRGSEVQRGLRIGKEHLELCTALPERQLVKLDVVDREQIETDQGGRGTRSELLDPGARRMQAPHQSGKIESAAIDDHQLAVENRAPARERLQRLDNLGEVPGERLPVPAPQVGRVLRPAECEAAEAVPLRVVGGAALREPRGQPREHGFDRWLQLPHTWKFGVRDAACHRTSVRERDTCPPPSGIVSLGTAWHAA